MSCTRCWRRSRAIGWPPSPASPSSGGAAGSTTPPPSSTGGAVAGIYRKLHPAIHRSVYAAGDGTPVFTAGGLTFGILICRDSTFPEPARLMAQQGATVLFVPTNNGMPRSKGGPELVTEAREADLARAKENGVFVVRADVAGRRGELLSWGSSAIVAPDGRVLHSARRLRPDLLVTEIGPSVPPSDAESRRGAVTLVATPLNG